MEPAGFRFAVYKWFRQWSVEQLWWNTDTKHRAASLRQQSFLYDITDVIALTSVMRCFTSLVRIISVASRLFTKSEGTSKVECSHYFWKCADTLYPKLSKL